MARIVLISPYLKGGKNAAKLAQRTRYVATRPGVELLADERSTLPATEKATRCGCTREQVWKRIFCAAVNLLKSLALIKKSYRQKKSIAKQRRQSGSLGRLK